MRLATLIAVSCLFCLGYVVQPIFGWRYHEKTRFDRSIDNLLQKDVKVYSGINKKPKIFSDFATQYTAYKDASQSICYLDKLKNDLKVAEIWKNVMQNNKKVVHNSDRTLSKIEAWRLAGDRIIDFCRGMKIILLEDEKHFPENINDPFVNQIQDDELDIIHKGASNNTYVIKNEEPLKEHMKKETKKKAFLKLREKWDRKYEKNFMEKIQRRKREATPYRGRFRGQTQSQYLNVGNEKEGKAEAEATQQSSRAVVSGSSGMGQAQSMSSGSEGCEGCPGYDRIGSVPASIPGILTSQQGGPTGVKKYLDKIQ